MAYRISRWARISVLAALLAAGQACLQAPEAEAGTAASPASMSAALAGGSGAAAAGDTLLFASPRRTGLAVAEVVGVNTLIWSYDRFIREGGENPGFRIGLRSWRENLRNGFEWDDNNFSTNQYAHPFHGSMYFNAARSNGYGFWGSIPFAFGGSFLWEYFYETHHPAYNDWVNTSIGGTALGEMSWRLSDLVLDNTATGGRRNWREVGGLLLNPVRGLTRLVTGEWSRPGPNAPGRSPGFLGLKFEAGMRTVGEGKVWEADTTRVFLEVQGQYGDPFGGDCERPFDSMNLDVLLNFGDSSALGGVSVHGLLGATELKDTETAQHLLGWFLNYDYVNTYAYEAGQQAVGVGLLSRFAATPLGPLDTEVHLNGIVLGGVESDYESYTGRDYDYGPGASAVLAAAWGRPGRSWLSLRHGQYWVHTLNGTAGEHHLSITRLRASVRIAQSAFVGLQYLLYLAENDYRDLPDTHKRFPELRASLTLPLQ